MSGLFTFVVILEIKTLNELSLDRKLAMLREITVRLLVLLNCFVVIKFVKTILADRHCSRPRLSDFSSDHCIPFGVTESSQ